MKRTIALISAAILLIFGILPAAAADEKLIWLDCDTVSNWSENAYSDTAEKTDGEASVAFDVSLDESPSVSFFNAGAAIDATGYNTLEFDIYFPAELCEMCENCAVEISSSGFRDEQEIQWESEFLNASYTDGWNHCILKLDEPGIASADFDIKNINWFRIYFNNIDPEFEPREMTVRFDNFYFTNKTVAEVEAEKTVQYNEPVGSPDAVTASVATAQPNLNSLTVQKMTGGLWLIFCLCSGGFLLAAAAFFAGYRINKKRGENEISAHTAVKKPKKSLLIASISLFAVGVVFAAGFAFVKLTYVVPEPDGKIEALLKADKNYQTTADYEQKAELKEINVTYPAQNTTVNTMSKYNPGQYITADVNVLDFGAVGDGKTNCTYAFRSAVETVRDNGGGTVFVPEGKYCLTRGIRLPQGVSLVGELENGTANGTVLYIYTAKGDSGGDAAITMNYQSGLKNIAFYYPEQQFVNGAPIPYPPTVRQDGSEGLLIENVNFINSYFAVDLSRNSNNSLQTVRDIYGTPLITGISLNRSYDIGRFENLNFSPDYWLKCGFENLPDARLLKTWLIRNATGFISTRVDWTYYSGFNISGYNTGIKYNKGDAGDCNGEVYDSCITDCYYAVWCDNDQWLNFTGCTLTAFGNARANAVYISADAKVDFHFYDCTLESCGKTALLNLGSDAVGMTGCKINSVNGTPFVSGSGNYTLVNCKLSGDSTRYNITQSDSAEVDCNIDYNRRIDSKPDSDAFINLACEPYSVQPKTDISSAMQQAVDSLEGSGGTVYLPGEIYYMDSPVTVREGVEIRGCEDLPHYMPYTVIYTDYGRGDEDGQALFTLMSGAGLRGIGVDYWQQSSADIQPFAYTARGNGSDIYIINVSLLGAYNGVDFATNKCDRHYIEYIWGTPLFRGIVIGAGSCDGIVRDVHYTPNAWHSVHGGANVTWDEANSFIMQNSQAFVAGECSGEILYNNFVYSANKGLAVYDGAQNLTAVSHGTDHGNIAFYAEGNCSVKLINPQLVDVDGVEMNYVRTGESFSGKLDIINSASWGYARHAFRIDGSGRVNFAGGVVVESGVMTVVANGGELSFSGVHTRTEDNKYDYLLEGNVTSLSANGNIYSGGLDYENNCQATLSGNDFDK